MVTIPFASDPGQVKIGAQNHATAFCAAAMAFEGLHIRSAERRIVHRQFIARADVAPHRQVEPFEPRIRIACVIDWPPLRTGRWLHIP